MKFIDKLREAQSAALEELGISINIDVHAHTYANDLPIAKAREIAEAVATALGADVSMTNATGDGNPFFNVPGLIPLDGLMITIWAKTSREDKIAALLAQLDQLQMQKQEQLQ